MYKNKHGFTIVELIIVIVVIAILAAVITLSYRGVQQTAQNAKTLSAASSYLDLLALYHFDNKTYPPMPESIIVDMCLGTVYTVDPAYGPDCVVLSPNAKTAAVSNQFKIYTGSEDVPEPSTIGYSNGPVLVRGVRLTYLPSQKLDGKQQAWWLTYVLGGTPAPGACVVGEVAYGDWVGGRGNMTLTEPASGIEGDPLSPRAFQCRVPLQI